MFMSAIMKRQNQLKQQTNCLKNVPIIYKTELLRNMSSITIPLLLDQRFPLCEIILR